MLLGDGSHEGVNVWGAERITPEDERCAPHNLRYGQAGPFFYLQNHSPLNRVELGGDWLCQVVAQLEDGARSRMKE